ncbi:hypothetical protein C8F01DRAFT_1259264 [Mycena amicta]|nr:hypothetical protein C8F01DRAFT_1259264 [Mycena amicta]
MAASDDYSSDGYDTDDSFTAFIEDDVPSERPMTRFGPRGIPPYFGPNDGSFKFRGYSNLRNARTFPSYYHCAPYQAYWPNDEVIPPPARHWCFLGEIVSFKGLLLQVRDTEGAIVPVGLYFKDGLDKFDFRTLKVVVKIFPCGLKTLLRINDDIEAETPEDRPQKCQGCGKEDQPDKLTLRRCSRCMSLSYCSSECQTSAWKRVHKSECKIFASVNELKRSRHWRNEHPTQWVAFGEREKVIVDGEAWQKDVNFCVQPEWKAAKPLAVTQLQGTFQVSSGELIWGQLASVLQGINNAALDKPSPGEDKASSGGGTVLVQGWTYRALAKIGLWKIAKVDGYGVPPYKKSTWIAYHSSYTSPIELLKLSRGVDWGTRMDNPRVAYVNRYDWGNNCADTFGAARMFAALDGTGTGWPAAVERTSRLSAAGKYKKAGHPDKERWERDPGETFDTRRERGQETGVVAVRGR